MTIFSISFSKACKNMVSEGQHKLIVHFVTIFLLMTTITSSLQVCMGFTMPCSSSSLSIINTRPSNPHYVVTSFQIRNKPYHHIISPNTRDSQIYLSSSTTFPSNEDDSIEPQVTGNDSLLNGLGDQDNTNSSSSRSSSKKTSPQFLLTLWRFTRPHTIIGSALAIPALHLLALPVSSSSSFTLPVSTILSSSIVYAMIPSLFMNLYITGLNQITDVEIDKINKPNLPIAKGDLTKRHAIYIVLISAILSLLMGSSWISNQIISYLSTTTTVAPPPSSSSSSMLISFFTFLKQFQTNGLNVSLWGSFILGTLYSLPPFRLKRYPFLAAFCIVAVRGIIINSGFYSHALEALHMFMIPSSQQTTGSISSNTMSGGWSSGIMAGMQTVWNCFLTEPKCFSSSLFFAVFGIVIALMKDVPDAKGDAIFNIKSFTVRLGQKNIFTLMRRLLFVSFLGVGFTFLQGALLAITTASCATGTATTAAASTIMTRMTSTLLNRFQIPFLPFCRSIVGISAIGAAFSVRQKAREVTDPEDSTMVYKYYMHLWKLFYFSYLILPFAR